MQSANRLKSDQYLRLFFVQIGQKLVQWIALIGFNKVLSKIVSPSPRNPRKIFMQDIFIDLSYENYRPQAVCQMTYIDVHNERET